MKPSGRPLLRCERQQRDLASTRPRQLLLYIELVRLFSHQPGVVSTGTPLSRWAGEKSRSEIDHLREGIDKSAQMCHQRRW